MFQSCWPKLGSPQALVQQVTLVPSHALKVKDEFPDLQVGRDSVSIDNFGYKASWTVGKDAKRLIEAATMAKVVFDAGKIQSSKLDKLKKQLASVLVWSFHFNVFSFFSAEIHFWEYKVLFSSAPQLRYRQDFFLDRL